MSDRIEALKMILSRIESERARGADFMIAPRVGWDGDMEHYAYRAYAGSLDAAKSLHEFALPDREGWEVYRTGKYPGMIPGSSPYKFSARVGYGSTTLGESDIAARAWLIAIIKALIARETDQ